MATWPSIANPDFGMAEYIYLPIVRTEKEANYVQTRKRATRDRGSWDLSWKAMSETDYQTLLTFFLANQGTSFTWVHPKTAVSYTCVFSTDGLQSKIISPTRRSVEVAIEEI
ncbi:hypothetical protein [Shewanella sp.]|jgi:hypothetical protein|uniref:hypothetical protein n=1 Tax=Shewanella sp. TaxID=50422 RepID=UPI0035620F29